MQIAHYRRYQNCLHEVHIADERLGLHLVDICFLRSLEAISRQSMLPVPIYTENMKLQQRGQLSVQKLNIPFAQRNICARHDYTVSLQLAELPASVDMWTELRIFSAADNVLTVLPPQVRKYQYRFVQVTCTP